MTFDLARLRADTPACAHVVHFNHAGSSPMPLPVIAAVTAHIRREAEMGSMEAGQAATEAIGDVYAAVADLLGCEADEIALTSGAGQSWGMAFAALRLQPGDRVLTHRTEWSSNLASMRRAGAVVAEIASDGDGCLDLDALGAALATGPSLLALTWVGANGGLINPVAEAGALARAAGVPFILDAAQALGQLPVDVRAIGCDVLIANGRKWLRGPRGTGILYVRRDFSGRLSPAFVDTISAPWRDGGPELRGDARRMETTEASAALRLGLGAAASYARAIGLATIRARIDAAARAVRDGLSRVPGVTLHDRGRERAGLVAFTVAGQSPDAVRTALAARRISVSVNGEAYTPLDMRARGLGEIVRAAPSYITSDDEIEILLQAVAALAI